jgi:hypothetical protein
MQRRTHYIFGSILLLAVICWWFLGRGSSPVDSAADGVVATAVTGQPPTVTEAERQRQFAVMEQDQQSFAAEISRRDADQQQRLRAGTKTAQFRKEIQFSRSGAWSQLIAANWEAYQTLRAQAAANVSGTTPCTICDGRGSMAVCFLCGNSGKCPTCFGTGKISGTELCPTCLGTGKCFLCGGTGKMTCPFCDDGIIYKTLPPPPQMLPIKY